MKKTILLHDASNQTSKNINKSIMDLTHESHNIILNTVHGNLFNIYQQHKPSYIFLNASEYTQEFQDFLMDHAGDTSIFLFIENNIDNTSLIEFWNSRPVKIIANVQYKNLYNNCVAVYDKMYNEQIFNNKKLNRNDKIAVMLSADNSKNNTIQEILYPNNFDRKVVVFNNPEFQSPVNLGILNASDLSIVLNSFDGLIDIDQQLYLEAQACNIKYYDIQTVNPKEAIINNNFKTLNANLNDYTYLKFTTEQILPNIKA